MILALAVLLLHPQVQLQPSININSSLVASAAVSSPAVSGSSNAGASAPAAAEVNSSSAAIPAATPAARPAVTIGLFPAATLMASAEPAPAEPIVLSPVPEEATESSSLALSTPPVSAGAMHPWKTAVFSVIDPKFENRRDQRMWFALSMAQSAGASFDAWTTRREISSGQAQELNPFLKPFAGNNSLYVVMQITPLALDYLARRMMYSSHSWERHVWWLPQVLGTASSFAAGGHNLTVRAIQ